MLAYWGWAALNAANGQNAPDLRGRVLVVFSIGWLAELLKSDKSVASTAAGKATRVSLLRGCG